MPIPGGYAPASTVAVAALAVPSPGVQVTVTAIAAGAATVTVFRAAPGGAPVPVRGASRAVVAGTSFTVADFEAPLGVLLTYTAISYDAAGGPSDESAGATITLASTVAWMTDPLTPSLAEQFMLARAPDQVMDIDTDLAVPIGATRPLLDAGPRQDGTFNLAFSACTPEDRDALRALLKATPIVLLRFPDTTWDVPSDYYAIGPLRVARLGPLLQVQGRRLEADATLVAPPAADIAAPLHTYAEMSATGLTYQQIKDTGRSYLQLVQLGAT